MDKKLTLKIIDGKNQLINSDEIKEHLIANNHQLTLEFESGETDDEYRKSLQNELTIPAKEVLLQTKYAEHVKKISSKFNSIII